MSRNPEMCDIATRVWCCRIGLVLTISSVLLTMMFQIWSYYFSLVRDMDSLSSSEPRLGAILSLCNKEILTDWNVVCRPNATHWACVSKIEGSTYIDSNCNGSDWTTVSLTACCRTMVWILPW